LQFVRVETDCATPRERAIYVIFFTLLRQKKALAELALRKPDRETRGGCVPLSRLPDRKSHF